MSATQSQAQSERVIPTARTSAARGRVRLRTLSNLRWMAITGQATALFVVYFGFGYPLPLAQCLVCVAFSAGLNIVLALRYPPSHRLTNREATVYLAYDVLQLAALLYLTGGIANPFALMFVAPVVIAASTLNLGNTLILGAIALATASLISVVHEPLPWTPAQPLVLPELYQAGLWASLVLGIGFTSIYAWRIASEGARMSAGLAATQLALARAQRLSSLGALATAAGRTAEERSELVRAYLLDLLPEAFHGTIRIEQVGEKTKPARQPVEEQSLLPKVTKTALADLQRLGVRSAKARERTQWFAELLREAHQA